MFEQQICQINPQKEYVCEHVKRHKFNQTCGIRKNPMSFPMTDTISEL